MKNLMMNLKMKKNLKKVFQKQKNLKLKEIQVLKINQKNLKRKKPIHVKINNIWNFSEIIKLKNPEEGKKEKFQFLYPLLKVKKDKLIDVSLYFF